MADARRDFRQGSEAAKESSKGAAFDRAEFFHIEDGEMAFLRFLMDPDEWISVDQHQMVPTKAKPADWPANSNWPESMPAVCRKSKMGDGKPLFADCYICENMTGQPARRTGRSWTLACLREEVLGDGTDAFGGPAKKGRRVGFRDKTREVAILGADGKPVEGPPKIVKALVLVNMGWRNFFSALDGAAKAYGTILDRDFVIIRSGKTTDTTYQINGLEPVPGFDCRIPEVAARYGITIHPDGTKDFPEHYDMYEVVMGRASDEYFAKFFDPTKTVASTNGNGSAPTTVIAKPNTEIDSDRMAQLAERLRSYGPEPAADPAAGSMSNY